MLVVWLVVSGILLFLAHRRASAGLDALQQARNELTAELLLEGNGQSSLEAAQSDFSSAHSLAANPILAPWSLVPIAGSNVDSVRDLTGAAQQVAQVGATTARAGSAALRARPLTGAQRLALLNQIAAIAASANRDVAHVDLGPDSRLIGPAASAHQKFVDKLEKVRSATSGAAALAAGAARLLTGPDRYLILAANNGEMRAGSGMFLEAGVATFANGSFTVGPMVPTPLIDVPPGAVPLPGSLQALWSFLAPNQSWRNLATTPRFDVTAPLAAQMWQAVTGQSVNGVLALDPVALKALLAAQGPIDAANQHLTASNVVSYLLLSQYEGVAANADPSGRVDKLGTVAEASVDVLASRPWESSALVTSLASIGKGRHVLAWSADPAEERGWQAAGIDGSLKTDLLAVSVMNFGGNKLDQFLTVDATLSITPLPRGGSRARVTVRLHNTAPTDLAGYVGGPNPSTDLQEGEYQGVLAVNVPGVASLPTLQGAGPLLAVGLDGPTKVVAGGYFQLPRGPRSRRWPTSGFRPRCVASRSNPRPEFLP